MVSLRDQTIQALRQEVAEWHGQAQALQAELEAARAKAAKATDDRDEAEMRFAKTAVERDRLRALLREERELVRQMVSRIRQTDIVAEWQAR